MVRLYLLKCRSIGRMLELFFNSGDKALAETFRGTSLELIPLFQLDKELYMNCTPEKADFKMSPLEKKTILADSTPPYQFLLYTVAKLSRSCEFAKEQGPLANDELRFKLPEDEIGMLINHQSPLLWEQCSTKVVRNAVADMLAHISFENKEFSLQVLQTLLTGIQGSTFDQMKTYERPLIKMLLIKDSYRLDRAKRALTGLQEIMKLNSLYYKDVDQVIEIVLKLLQKSETAVEYVNKNPQLLRLIEQWCKEYAHFPLNQTKTKIFRQGQIVWNQLKNMQIN